MIALSNYYCCTVSGTYLISPEKRGSYGLYLSYDVADLVFVPYLKQSHILQWHIDVFISVPYRI